MWKDIEPFAEYAFNKSHSASYGVITMRTAYLKARYPEETMAAVLSSHTGKTDKIIKYINECRKSGLEVMQPDINKSYREFTAVPGEGIRFGLAGIRGIGEAVANHVIEIRKEGGDFPTLHDFIERIDPHIVGAKTIESLVKAGAFDSTGYPRRQLYLLLNEGGIFEAAAKRHKDRCSGQVSMFDLFTEEDHGFNEDIPEPEPCDWDKRIKLSFEKELLGVFASDHPLRDIESVLAEASDYTLDQVEEFKGGEQGWFAGMITSVDIRPTKRGPMMALLILEDLGGTIECVVFPKIFEQYRDTITDEAMVRMLARFESDDRGSKLIVSRFQPFDGTMFARPLKKVILKTTSEQLKDSQFSTNIRTALSHYPGKDVVELSIYDPKTDRTMIAVMGEKVDAYEPGLKAELAIHLGIEGYEIR
jgi:DNA polymerase-3 subunit alpha